MSHKSSTEILILLEHISKKTPQANCFTSVLLPSQTKPLVERGRTGMGYFIYLIVHCPTCTLWGSSFSFLPVGLFYLQGKQCNRTSPLANLQVVPVQGTPHKVTTSSSLLTLLEEL